MTPQMENRLTASAHLTKRKIMINNFFGGLAWGLGTVIGATIVVALLVSFLKLFNFIPLINDVINQYNDTRITHQLNR